MTPLELILSETPKKSSARRLRRRAENLTARGQKISSPQPPPFFARSPDEKDLQNWRDVVYL
ncbi:MAG: hypothetical protein Q8P63_03205, partial [Candidatus Nealsonbacteria bacterium]|nr:hypothetical protein [Candidatus Nealsonbacteria bacterium]